MWRLSNDLTRNHIFKNPIRKVQEVRQLGCNETWRYLRGINRSFDFGSFGGGYAMRGRPSNITKLNRLANQAASDAKTAKRGNIIASLAIAKFTRTMALKAEMGIR